MTTLGKYELDEEIGKGSFATVYRATHKQLKTEAAVKVLNSDRLRDPIARERMMQEAKISAKLKHPHIIDIFDLINDGASLAIAMEYVSGGNLREWVTEEKPSIAEILFILAQIADALDYIHGERYQSDRPLIHRDVKPENILMDVDTATKKPKAKLSDFGLVLDIENSPQLTQAQGIPGTAYYISPEQVETLPKDSLDGRVDQYALGVVAYELLVGKRPFEGNDPIVVMNKRLDDTVQKPSTANPELPLEFDSPLLNVLKIKPEERYKNCAKFMQALNDAWQESRLRRVRELIDVAQEFAKQGDFKSASSSLDEATTFDANNKRLVEARKGITQQAIRAQNYAEGVQAWNTAKQKAKAVLDLDPDFKDKKNILITLGARPPEAKPFDMKGWLKQIGVGFLLALPFTVILIYLAIRWIVNH